MTSVRGRAVIDFIRFGLRAERFMPKNPYASRSWWDDVYLRYEVARFEWGVEYYQLRDYRYTDATPRGVPPATAAAAAAAAAAAGGGGGGLRGSLSDHAPRHGRTLLLGIGTSTMTEEMFVDGWRDVTAVDFSQVRAWGLVSASHFRVVSCSRSRARARCARALACVCACALT